MTVERKGRLYVLVAAVLFSTSGLFIKSPMLSSIEPLSARGPVLACSRTMFAALFLLAFRPWRTIRWRPELIPLLLSFAAMNVLLVCGMTRADAGDAIFLQYSAPLWVFAIGVIWLREPLVRTNIAALAVGMAGVAVIVLTSVSTPDWLGVVLALGSGVGYAGVILSLRALRGEDSIALIFLCLATSSLVLLPWAGGEFQQLTAHHWYWLAVFSVIQIGIPYVLFARGLRHVLAQESSLISLVEPLLNPVWVLMLWGVAISPRTITGGGLILLSLLFVWYTANRNPVLPNRALVEGTGD